MEKNKIRKVKMNGRGLSGIEVHYINDVRRSGLDVIRTNQSKDPIPVPIEIRDEMQKLKFYFMLIMMQMEQEDERFLNDEATSFLDDVPEADMDRFRIVKLTSQKIYVIQYEIDDDNSCSVTADVEMLDQKVKGITTVKVTLDDDFPRYYDMVRIIRSINKKVEDYVFGSSGDTGIGIKDLTSMLKELMPKKSEDIEEMDEIAKKELYRSYLEDHGHIVISSEDMSDEDPQMDDSRPSIPGIALQDEEEGIDTDGDFVIPEAETVEQEDVKTFSI